MAQLRSHPKSLAKKLYAQNRGMSRAAARQSRPRGFARPAGGSGPFRECRGRRPRRPAVFHAPPQPPTAAAPPEGAPGSQERCLPLPLDNHFSGNHTFSTAIPSAGIRPPAGGPPRVARRPRRLAKCPRFESPKGDSANKKTAKMAVFFFGDPAGIRSPDPLLKRQLLCLLSY